jgi:NAD(P)-dependent dehydrogenase (short-subunit alcohol dehydrogenase family)
MDEQGGDASGGMDRRKLISSTAALAAMGTLVGRIAAAAEGEALQKTADQQITVLITGASRGIGLEFAQRYARSNWRVIATCRDPGKAEALQALATQHQNVMVEPLDVLDHAGIDALAARYASQPIDILLNNAGIGGGMENQLFGRLNYATFNEVMAVNAIGPMKVCEAFVKHVEASRLRKMITVSSSQGSIGSVDAPRLYWYRSSKSALNMLMANLAFQLKSRGIIVGLVTPGATDTDFMKGLPKKMLRPVADAVTDMAREIDRFDLSMTGQFLDTKGQIIPW